LYPNGDEYRGSFFEGEKSGKGVYIYKNEGKHPVDVKIETYLQKDERK